MNRLLVCIFVIIDNLRIRCHQLRLKWTIFVLLHFLLSFKFFSLLSFLVCLTDESLLDRHCILFVIRLAYWSTSWLQRRLKRAFLFKLFVIYWLFDLVPLNLLSRSWLSKLFPPFFFTDFFRCSDLIISDLWLKSMFFLEFPLRILHGFLRFWSCCSPFSHVLIDCWVHIGCRSSCRWLSWLWSLKLFRLKTMFPWATCFRIDILPAWRNSLMRLSHRLFLTW